MVTNEPIKKQFRILRNINNKRMRIAQIAELWHPVHKENSDGSQADLVQVQGASVDQTSALCCLGEEPISPMPRSRLSKGDPIGDHRISPLLRPV